MAPSSWDASFLNSTSGLLSVLDLNHEQNQNMEDMDIDQVADVPDTPDRLAARSINGGECVEKESKFSVAGHSGNPAFLDAGVPNRLRGRDRLVTENGNGRRLHFHPQRNLSNLDKTEHYNSSGRDRLVTENGHSRRLHFHPQRNLSNLDKTEHYNSSIVSSSESSSASRSAHLSRRMIADKTSKHESEYSIGAQHMDKGKALCTKFPIKASACQENNTVLDLNEQNGCIQILEMAFPGGASKDPLAEEIRKGSIATNECSSLHCIAKSSKTSSNVCKGKEKTDDATCKDAGLGMDRGKGIDFSIDSQPKTEKYIPASLHSITSPRVTGQKRLVRNGCISPHNIARAKQFAERNSSGSKDVERNDTGNVVSNGSPCLIDVSDLIAEDNNSNRVKGKGVIIHPCTSKEHDARTRQSSGRSSIIHIEEASGTSDASRDAFGCFEGLGGWRSTRNRSKKIGLPLSDEDGCLSRRNDGVGSNQQHENRVNNIDNRIGNNNRTEYDYPEVWDAVSSQHGPVPPLAQVASSLVSESDQVDGRHRVANTLIKRQKKHGSILSNHGERSTSGFGDSEIVFLGSSGDPSNSRSTRNRSCHRRGVIEIDELSPEIGLSDSLDIGCVNNDDSDARARQLEADEILARELQEQLYQEVPVVGGGEIDAHLAWTLQHQDSQHASSSGSHHILHPRGSSISPIYRQSRSRPFQNPSSRRGAQARVPTSTRMAQLRSRIRGQSPTILSRERNLQFPLNMDLDMRIDILEALEAAVGDFSDMRMASNILQVQRDFNENDYEMLLALDENNHQHGASVNQINSLPESTVQTDNFEEACAICLENPTFGDTIRHLPCLHKFHKDCIDPWLSRKTSCPVCKSSIT